MWKEKRLSDRMKKEAVELGLCAQWTAEWAEGTTKDEMVDKFVRGLDFCIEHDWPSAEVIKKDFGDVIHRHGVWVDERVIAEDPDTLILNGSCDGSITCGHFSASNIYLRHKSRASILVRNLAYVHISVYDDADLRVSCEGGAKCFVYQYGGKVRPEGNVVVRNKRKENGV